MNYNIQSFIWFTQKCSKVTIVFYIKLILFTINTCKQWRVMKAKNLDNEWMYPFVSNTTMNESYYGLTLLYILYFCVTEYIFSDNKVSFSSTISLCVLCEMVRKSNYDREFQTLTMINSFSDQINDVWIHRKNFCKTKVNLLW